MAVVFTERSRGYQIGTLLLYAGASYAIYVLEVSGMIVLFLASLFSVIRNFCLPVVTYRRSTQILAIWGGIKLFIGAMIFVGDVHGIISDIPSLHYGPSFGLVVTGSIVATIAGIVIAVNSRPAIAFVQFGMDPTAAQTVFATQYGYPAEAGNLYYAGGGGQTVVATVTTTSSAPGTVKMG
nr:hypothetical protein BaRGS_027991 [Batillaria attramentaria]